MKVNDFTIRIVSPETIEPQVFKIQLETAIQSFVMRNQIPNTSVAVTVGLPQKEPDLLDVMTKVSVSQYEIECHKRDNQDVFEAEAELRYFKAKSIIKLFKSI